MGKFKKKIPLFIAALLLVISVFFLLFPTVSNAIFNANNQSSIKEYNLNVSTLSKEEKETYLSEARAYNQSLTNTVTDAFTALSYENIKPSYDSVLNFDNGQICSLEIPAINLSIAVYHGISEDVLNYGAAHSANTSFPIGGADTHAVISAHTACPGKVFFDNLTELKKGDLFYINVLDKRLIYKISEINIVKPEDTRKLQIIYGKDLITLVTCYPYAVNSHRLLVTGERINTASTVDQTTGHHLNINYIMIMVMGIIVIIVVLILISLLKKRKG